MTWRTTLARNVALAAIYIVAARLGLLMDAVAGFATLVWAPSGIALAALLLFGRRLWPGVAAGAFIANLWTGAPIFVAFGIAFGNTLECVIAVSLLARFGFRASFARLRDVLLLIGLAA